jgi:hypothetical protein
MGNMLSCILSGLARLIFFGGDCRPYWRSHLIDDLHEEMRCKDREDGPARDIRNLRQDMFRALNKVVAESHG